MNTSIPSSIAQIAPDGNISPRQARHLMINMLKRRMRAGTGSSLEFLTRRTAVNSWPDLRPILAGIDWVVVGGVATRAYMPERMTQDMDILVRQTDQAAIITKLKEAGYQVISPLAIGGYALRSPEGVEVDVLVGDSAWLGDALTRSQYDAAGFPVIDLPYLILLKMSAQRAQDWADVSRMLGLASDDRLDEVRAIVARYAPEDSEDLESLIFIGKQEQSQ